MDSDIEKMMQENLALTKENNAILRKLLRAQKLANIYRVIYWIIIIALSAGAIYLVQPYINTLLGYYHAVTGSNLTLPQ